MMTKSEVNLYLEENKLLGQVLIYSEEGNVNIKRNRFMSAGAHSLYLTRSKFHNLTENVFSETLRSKFAGKGYIEVEKNIDKEITNYINVDVMYSDNMLVEKNTVKIGYYLGNH